LCAPESAAAKAAAVARAFYSRFNIEKGKGPAI
jgi:hypothetical protein